MIIVCNSCSAQYSVSDAKVRGKLVRITCKHCTTAIVVDGRTMTETEVASQKPLSGYALPRRDESIIATMPHSLAPARAPAPAPVTHAPTSASAHRVPSTFATEEDQTMIARSRFGDDMSVHDERTVIGQIPKEALEFERMFAQRTQPPPPDSPSASGPAAPAAGSVPKDAPLPSFSSEPPAPGESSEPPSDSADDEAGDEAGDGPLPAFSGSEPPTVGNQPSSDSRGLVSLAEATHPSVARTVTARRLRVTLITLLVLAVLVALFVIQTPR